MNWLDKVRGSMRIESVAVLVLMFVTMAVFAPNFLSANNLLNIVLATSVIGILAVGSTFVIASAGIDLSVGSVMALAMICGAVIINAGAPWYLGAVMCLVAGGLVGTVSGSLIAWGHLPPFIVTLGMLSAARGLGFVISDGRPLYGLPDAMLFIGQGRPFGIPVPVIIFIVVVVVSHLVMRHTKFGRYTLVIGDSEKTAVATGIAVKRHKTLLYALSGALAGLGGLIFMTRLNAADPTAGVMAELAAITAVIIGGTNLFGGTGTIIGTLIGALIMGILQNGLNLLAVPTYYQQVSIGVVLVLAVWLDRYSQPREE